VIRSLRHCLEVKNMKFTLDKSSDTGMPVPPKPLDRLKVCRKFWLNIHLYLGLSAGGILAVVGLTGAILVFYQELQEVVNPELAVVQVPSGQRQQPGTLDDIIAAAEKRKPPDSRIFKVYYPRKAELAYKLLYYVRDAKRADNGDGYYIFVDPYTLQVKGIQLWHPKGRYWGRPLVSFIMQLHWCLLLGKPGGTIIGILGVLSIVSVLTGLIVWWPLTGKFKQALSFKPQAGAVRLVFDLHKTVGFYATVVLLVVLFSGVYFNLPAQVGSLVGVFSPVHRINAWTGMAATDYASTVRPGVKPLGYTQIEASVRHHYPSGRFWMLEAPQQEQGAYKVWKREVGEVSRFVGYREFIVDRYSGEILNVYDSGAGSGGDVFLDWQWPLHSGQAFGWTGRILVLLSGLACPVLFFTGIIRWLQKRKAKQFKKVKRTPQAAANRA
jgi:uncharacterized iron-regulated membrane protein